MTRLRRHRPQGASTRERRFAPHLIVLAMLITFLPHCLFGCSMGMQTPAPATMLAAVMDCCDTACPMDHPDECLAMEHGQSAPDAILQKSDPAVADFAPVLLAEASSPSAGAEAWTFPTEGGPLSHPIPLHLLNAQFLI